MNQPLISYVALCNDQTDALKRQLERLKETTDPIVIQLTIDHLELLQRSLAKSVDQEIEYHDRLTNLLDRFVPKTD